MLKLLPAWRIRQYLVPMRPSPTCGICGEPFNRHDARFACDCGRCGLEFAWECYWDRVASAPEKAFAEVATEDELHAYIFLCRNCRS
jgi:hypothetical protein